MELNIFDLAPLLSDTDKCIEFLRGRNLLLQDYICCNNTCSKVKDSKLSDKRFFNVIPVTGDTQYEQKVSGRNQNWN